MHSRPQLSMRPVSTEGGAKCCEKKHDTIECSGKQNYARRRFMNGSRTHVHENGRTLCADIENTC